MEICDPSHTHSHTQRPQYFAVTVNVIEAKNLTWQHANSFVTIKIGKEFRITPIQRETNKPFYNEFHTFDFFLPLNSLLEKQLTIGIHTGSKKSSCFRRLLGNVRMDLGLVWIQRYHQFYHKWAALTHPKRNHNQIQGYLKLDIAILETGNLMRTPFYVGDTDNVQKNLLLPCPQESVDLCIGKYNICIHSASNFRSQYETILTTNQKFTYSGKIDVTISFASFKVSTTSKMNEENVHWNELFTFFEVYPPMYQLIKLSVRINGDIICSKIIFVKDIWNCSVKGFLPTFGPAYIHFYDKNSFYQGSVLLGVMCEKMETHLLPHWHLKMVQRHHLSGFNEQDGLSFTDYVVFGAIFEVSVLRENLCPGKDIIFTISMGTYGTSVTQNEESFNMTLAMECKPSNEGLYNLKISQFKPCLYLRSSWPDVRYRFYLSNTIEKMVLLMKQGMSSARRQICIGNNPLAHEQLNKMMEQLLAMCTGSMTLPYGATALDRVRISSFKVLLDSVVKTITAFHWKSTMTEKFHIACSILNLIEQLMTDPQETFPDVVLNLWKNKQLVSNCRIPAKDLLQADHETRSGKCCGKVLSFFLKPLKDNVGMEVNGKVDIFLWLGPAANIGKCLELLPNGCENLSSFVELPRYIRYPHSKVFECRAYVYQGQFVLRDTKIDQFSPAVRIIMKGEIQSTQVVKRSISPIWDEMLDFNKVTMYTDGEYLKKHPPSVVIELLNKFKGQEKLVGITTALPLIKLHTDLNESSEKRLKMDWFDIYDGYNKRIGEILALFEYREVLMVTDSTVPQEIKKPSSLTAHKKSENLQGERFDESIDFDSSGEFHKNTIVKTKSNQEIRATPNKKLLNEKEFSAKQKIQKDSQLNKDRKSVEESKLSIIEKLQRKNLRRDSKNKGRQGETGNINGKIPKIESLRREKPLVRSLHLGSDVNSYLNPVRQNGNRNRESIDFFGAVASDNEASIKKTAVQSSEEKDSISGSRFKEIGKGSKMFDSNLQSEGKLLKKNISKSIEVPQSLDREKTGELKKVAKLTKVDLSSKGKSSKKGEYKIREHRNPEKLKTHSAENLAVSPQKQNMSGRKTKTLKIINEPVSRKAAPKLKSGEHKTNGTINSGKNTHISNDKTVGDSLKKIKGNNFIKVNNKSKQKKQSSMLRRDVGTSTKRRPKNIEKARGKTKPGIDLIDKKNAQNSPVTSERKLSVAKKYKDVKKNRNLRLRNTQTFHDVERTRSGGESINLVSQKTETRTVEGSIESVDKNITAEFNQNLHNNPELLQMTFKNNEKVRPDIYAENDVISEENIEQKLNESLMKSQSSKNDYTEKKIKYGLPLQMEIDESKIKRIKTLYTKDGVLCKKEEKNNEKIVAVSIIDKTKVVFDRLSKSHAHDGSELMEIVIGGHEVLNNNKTVDFLENRECVAENVGERSSRSPKKTQQFEELIKHELPLKMKNEGKVMRLSAVYTKDGLPHENPTENDTYSIIKEKERTPMRLNQPWGHKTGIDEKQERNRTRLIQGENKVVKMKALRVKRSSALKNNYRARMRSGAEEKTSGPAKHRTETIFNPNEPLTHGNFDSMKIILQNDVKSNVFPEKSEKLQKNLKRRPISFSLKSDKFEKGSEKENLDNESPLTMKMRENKNMELKALHTKDGLVHKNSDKNKKFKFLNLKNSLKNKFRRRKVVGQYKKLDEAKEAKSVEQKMKSRKIGHREIANENFLSSTSSDLSQNASSQSRDFKIKRLSESIRHENLKSDSSEEMRETDDETTMRKENSSGESKRPATVVLEPKLYTNGKSKVYEIKKDKIHQKKSESLPSHQLKSNNLESIFLKSRSKDGSTTESDFSLSSSFHEFKTDELSRFNRGKSDQNKSNRFLSLFDKFRKKRKISDSKKNKYKYSRQYQIKRAMKNPEDNRMNTQLSKNDLLDDISDPDSTSLRKSEQKNSYKTEMVMVAPERQLKRKIRSQNSSTISDIQRSFSNADSSINYIREKGATEKSAIKSEESKGSSESRPSNETQKKRNSKAPLSLRKRSIHSRPSSNFLDKMEKEYNYYETVYDTSMDSPSNLYDTSKSEDDVSVNSVVRIPHGIRPIMQDYWLEILFWGLRDIKEKLRYPFVTITVADQTVESKPIWNMQSFPNFNQASTKMSIKLPVENLYLPSAVIKLYSHNICGRKRLKGYYVIKNLHVLKAHMIKVEDWNRERNRNQILLNKNQDVYSETEEEVKIEIDPLIEHKELVTVKEEPKSFRIHIHPKIDAVKRGIYNLLKYILLFIVHLLSGIDQTLQKFFLYFFLKEIILVPFFFITRISSYFSWLWEPCVTLCFKYGDTKEDLFDDISVATPPPTDFHEERDVEDWWTKYLNSLEAMGDLKKNKMRQESTKNVFICDCCQDLPTECRRPLRKNLSKAGLMIYNHELEKQPEFQDFQDILKKFPLYGTGRSVHCNPRDKDTVVFKGAISISPPVPENHFVSLYGEDASLGFLRRHSTNQKQSLVVRVYIIQAHNLHAQDLNLKADAYINIYLGKRKVASNRHEYVAANLHPIFGKCFEVEAKFPRDSALTVQLMDFDKFSPDDMIGATTIDLEARFYSKHRGHCGLSQTYYSTGPGTWRDTMKPTEILQELCERHQALGPTYYYSSVVINSKQFFVNRINMDNTEDVKENLALAVLRRWHELPFIGCCLVPEHVETRSLYRSDKPGVEQGWIEMWVDIFPKKPGAVLKPIVNIEPRRPQEMQLRVSILNTAHCALKDEAFFSERHSDLYVKGWLIGKMDTQKTDIHYYSLTGEGNFNWRFIFNFFWLTAEKMIYVHEDKLFHSTQYKIPPRLHLQVWDSDKILRDDFIGMLILDLMKLPKPAYSQHGVTPVMLGRNAPIVNLFTVKKIRGWWPFTDLDKKNKNKIITGMLEAELELVTMQEAKKHPVGYGHDEPSALPYPDRPEIAWNYFTGIVSVFHYVLIPTIWHHKGKILTFCTALAFVYFIVLFIYAFPGYAAKKFVGA